MSTRANIVIKANHIYQYGNDPERAWLEELWFYRHSDGYPEGAMPTLQKFINWVRSGKLRDNVEQASGWLILIGAEEYSNAYVYNKKTHKGKYVPKPSLTEPFDDGGCFGWKCGAYEPSSSGRHGDIEFLYIIDLMDKTIACYKTAWYGDEEIKNTVMPKDKLLFTDTAENPWKPEPETVET